MKKYNTREKLLDIAFEEVYMNGYRATSVDTILKRANVPKGSMYHYFKSKKELVLATIKEKLYPKMDNFFNFSIKEESVLKSIEKLYITMSKNKMLVEYGCPLYRLMVELSATDKDFDKILTKKAIQMQNDLSKLLQKGVDTKEFNKNLDTKEFAKFILNATWGILSVSPTLSSSKNFIDQSKYIIKQLKYYTK